MAALSRGCKPRIVKSVKTNFDITKPRYNERILPVPPRPVVNRGSTVSCCILTSLVETWLTEELETVFILLNKKIASKRH